MNSFGPQSFTTPIKRLLPNDSKFKKEAITLITSIIYEINNNFVNACLENNNNGKEINVKHVRESIKNIIPGELKKYAFAEANSKILKYNSGLIDYKGPEIEKEIGLDTRILRKCLEQITQVVNSDLTLSKDCTVFISIIQKLATQIAEKAIETIGDKPEMSLEDMRNVVSCIIGEEMFQHSEGHAESNLEWYSTDHLDFTIKPLIIEVEENVPDDGKTFWGKCVQKTLKSKYSMPITKETMQCFEKVLNDLIKRVFKEIKFAFDQGIDNVSSDSIAEEHVIQAFRTLLPEPLFKMALCSAQAKLLNYRCGILKYNYERKEEEVIPISKEEPKDASMVPDFRKGVKHLLNLSPCPYSNGFLPFINDILNEIGSAIVGRSSVSARGNDNVLSENNIIEAINDILPNQLRKHAIARIAHIQMELGQPCFQLTGHVSSNIIQPTEIISSNIIQPTERITEENHTQSAKESLKNTPNTTISSPPSEVLIPTKSQSDSFVNSKQMPNIVGSDTDSENRIHEGFLEPRRLISEDQHLEHPIDKEFLDPRESQSKENNNEQSSLDLKKLDRSHSATNEPQIVKYNNGDLPVSGNSEPRVQLGHETNIEKDSEGELGLSESVTSNRVFIEKISSIISQMENPGEDRSVEIQNALQEESDYSFLPDEISDSHEQDLMLDIQRKIYWLDVRPYEI